MKGSANVSYQRFSDTGAEADSPLRAIGSSPKLYIVDVNTQKPAKTLSVSAYSGTPPSGSFGKFLLSFSIPTLASPPASANVEPSNLHMDLDDDRPRSGIVTGNTAYVAGQAQCTSKGDTQARSCPRLFALNLSTETVIKDATLAIKGQSLEYPAIAVDHDGNVCCRQLLLAHARSRHHRSSLQTKPRRSLESRNPPTRQHDDQRQRPPVRLGDYAGASVDPTSPKTVWVTNEYGRAPGNWGTLVAHLGMG
jgi:hypothetical protein